MVFDFIEDTQNTVLIKPLIWLGIGRKDLQYIDVDLP